MTDIASIPGVVSVGGDCVAVGYQETVRERIIQAFIARAESILTENGYNTQIGTHVFRAIKELDPSFIPACNILPLSDGTPERIGGGEYQATFSIRVEGLVRFGSLNPSVAAELLLGDLRKAFMRSSISDLIDEINYMGGGTDEYPDAKTHFVLSVVTFSVKYFTNIYDPY